MNLSKIDSCTSARDGQVHTSPLLNANSANPSSALSKNASSASITSAMKMFGDLPPSSMVLGIRFSAAYCMICRPVVVSPVKLILAMRGLDGERRANLGAVAVDHVQHARRQYVADQVHQHTEAQRRVGGRLDHHAISGGERRRHLPCRHQQRKVPRNDLSDHAHRLMEMIGDGVVVEFRQRAFLGADAAGEIAEMIGRQRHIGVGRLADRLAVVHGLGIARAVRDSPRSDQRSCSAFGRVRPARCGPRHPSPHARHPAPARRPRRPSAPRRTACTPSIGLESTKYRPLAGACHLPPMKLS